MGLLSQLPSVACGFIFACAGLFGQAAENFMFEAASVRPSAKPDSGGWVNLLPPRGGPGTRDPGQITWSRARLREIVTTAYGVQTFQINAPDWFSTEEYDIVAKVATGAMKEQVSIMWQNLLKERFGLVLHHESKEFRVDELTMAKDGPKLKLTDLAPDGLKITSGSAKLDVIVVDHAERVPTEN